MSDNYVRRFRLLRVVDGDSIHATVDKGYRDYGDESIRLLDVDTHEINKGTAEDRAKGMEAVVRSRVVHPAPAPRDEPELAVLGGQREVRQLCPVARDVYCQCGSHLAAELRAAGYDTGRRWAGVNTLRAVEGGGA